MGEGSANIIYFAYGSNMCPQQMAVRCPGGRAFGQAELRDWQFLINTLSAKPSHLTDAIRLAVQGHHLITTTQQALHVDAVKTFFEVASSEFEKFASGSREAMQQAEAYASDLMHAIQDRFDQGAGGVRALRANADVLLKAGQFYCASVKKEFQHQVSEPLEAFQEEIERIVSVYAVEAHRAG